MAAAHILHGVEQPKFSPGVLASFLCKSELHELPEGTSNIYTIKRSKRKTEDPSARVVGGTRRVHNSVVAPESRMTYSAGSAHGCR